MTLCSRATEPPGELARGLKLNVFNINAAKIIATPILLYLWYLHIQYHFNWETLIAEFVFLAFNIFQKACGSIG